MAADVESVGMGGDLSVKLMFPQCESLQGFHTCDKGIWTSLYSLPLSGVSFYLVSVRAAAQYLHEAGGDDGRCQPNQRQ